VPASGPNAPRRGRAHRGVIKLALDGGLPSQREGAQLQRVVLLRAELSHGHLRTDHPTPPGQHGSHRQCRRNDSTELCSC
jgi:hypothetical protein